MAKKGYGRKRMRDLNLAKCEAIEATFTTEITHVVVEYVPKSYTVVSEEYAQDNGLTILYRPERTEYEAKRETGR